MSIKHMHNRIITKKFTGNVDGFTLIELIVVVVIIAILSGISYVAYSNWEIKAVEAQLKSDLSGAAAAMDNSRTYNNTYPASVPNSFIASSDTTLVGGSSDGRTFCIDATSTRETSLHFYIDYYIKTKGARPGTCATRTLCPSGFVVVPGSSTYKTSDFCVMKFEAKNAGGNVPVSRAAGTPWVSVSQSDASVYARNVVGCTDCHIISEAEWMTIAQNVMNIGLNWSSGVVGSGYIFSGHTDGAPNSPLAVSDEGNPYSDTLNSSGQNTYTELANQFDFVDYIIGNSQRRTFNLSNGSVIWDFSGNIWEGTSGIIDGSQPAISGRNYGSWDYIDLNINTDKTDTPIMPISTGILGSDKWTSANGIGKLYSSANETDKRAFGRGGDYQWGSAGGILALGLDADSAWVDNRSGFRVAAPIQE